MTFEVTSECFPEADIVTPFTFVIKSIDPVDACTLVISAQDEEVLRIFDLEGEQQTDRL